ncbi:hypothetical protein [Streptomyces avermitilis]|uniref:hypothetical protein n=1 Tax=Streptomyces avermitilis TaxID=33903 RepID=UPI0033ACAF43
MLISAGSPRLLDGHIGELLDFLDSSPGTPPAAMAHTLGGREMLTARLAVVAGSSPTASGATWATARSPRTLPCRRSSAVSPSPSPARAVSAPP